MGGRGGDRAPSQAVTTQRAALAAARTAELVPPGEIRSLRAVKLAFPVLLVGGKLAKEETSLGGRRAGSKCGSVFGKVGRDVALPP